MRLKLPSGIDYGTGANGEQICRGAMVGRDNKLPADPTIPRPLRMERLRFIDGGYDTGGAYWGGPANLYCAYDYDTMVFVRADTREAAKEKVRALVPGARFYR